MDIKNKKKYSNDEVLFIIALILFCVTFGYLSKGGPFYIQTNGGWDAKYPLCLTFLGLANVIFIYKYYVDGCYYYTKKFILWMQWISIFVSSKYCLLVFNIFRDIDFKISKTFIICDYTVNILCIGYYILFFMDYDLRIDSDVRKIIVKILGVIFIAELIIKIFFAYYFNGDVFDKAIFGF